MQEFDDLFAASLRRIDRIAPTALRLTLDPAAEASARELAVRESACCSFFSFGFYPATGALQVDVEVPPAHAAVLDALAARVGDKMGPVVSPTGLEPALPT